MDGERVGTDQGDTSSLSDYLQSEAFQKGVEERAIRAFEEEMPLETTIALLWPDDSPIWGAIRDEIPTPEWHGTATDIQPLVRTHILRLANGWKNESMVVRYLQHRPYVVQELGYETRSEIQQSKLWRAWNERYSDTLKELIEETADIVVREARNHDIPAPDDVFRPSEETTSTPAERTERKLISKHTKEVWQQAKPFIEDSFYLDRGENAEIDEGAWWEQHTFLGMRKDMYAESGADSFRDDTTRDRAPAGRHHRDKLRVLDVDAIREMMHNTTRALVARARHNSELVGNLNVAIDITKGHPWTGEIERDQDGGIDEPYILGYSDGQLYYQWASIQVIGYDIPLVLDVVPVKRGAERADIVDELLSNAMDIVGGIELVMMDREFDGEGVKSACEKHGVYYLNPKRKYASERATCTRLREAGKTVHINSQETISGENRKKIYVPATASDAEPAEEDLDDEATESDGREESDIRQEMIDDLAVIGVEMEEETDASGGISDVLDEIEEEEDESVTFGKTEDARAYAVFETNHPDIEVNSAESTTEQIHMAERMVRRYRHRWGIENGFKKIKNFMVRTSSKNHQYRFFNFAFACVLYNVWRLVDLLVKLAIDGENGSYAPKVDANRFLTHAKKYYGLDPPD